MILKGQTTSNDWLEFRIHNIIKCDQYWTHVWNMGEYVTINTDTIHLADDPRAESAELATLREQVKVLQETLDKAAEVADYLHRACLNPSRPRQAIGEMANYLLNTLIAALKQTKPKDSEEVKL